MRIWKDLETQGKNKCNRGRFNLFNKGSKSISDLEPLLFIDAVLEVSH